MDHDAFRERALTWDNEQRLMVEEYQRRKKELDDKFDRDKQSLLPDGTKGYVVEKWTQKPP